MPSEFERKLQERDEAARRAKEEEKAREQESIRRQTEESHEYKRKKEARVQKINQQIKEQLGPANSLVRSKLSELGRHWYSNDYQLGYETEGETRDDGSQLDIKHVWTLYGTKDFVTESSYTSGSSENVGGKSNLVLRQTSPSYWTKCTYQKGKIVEVRFLQDYSSSEGGDVYPVIYYASGRPLLSEKSLEEYLLNTGKQNVRRIK